MKTNINIKRLLIYAIAAFMMLGAASTVNAEISTSTVTAVTTEYTPGDTGVDLEFQLHAYSSDVAYVTYVELDFPVGVTVNSAEDVGDIEWLNPTGETGDGVLTTWGAMASTSYGYEYNSDVNFKVNVDIDSGFTGSMTIDWYLYSDEYGDPPHDASGIITIVEAAPDYCYFEEDFGTGDFSQWTVNGAGPGIVSTSNAGGTSPECRFYYSTAESGDYILSNPVDTSSESDLWMQFRSMINHYSISYPYNLFVEVTPDGSTWYDVTPWPNPVPDDFAAARYLINIPQAIGTQTSVRFMITGDTYGLNYWYLDDIKICDFITYTDGAMLTVIQPDPYATGGWTSLIPVQTRVANLGNTPQNPDVNVVISHEVGGGTLLFETFDSSWGPQGDNPPPGWQIYDLGGNGIWENNDWYRYTSYSGCPRVYYSPYEDDQNDCLVSPSVDCTGLFDVRILIDYMYSYFSSSSGTNIRAYIEGSIDGGMTFPYTVDQWDYNGDGSKSDYEWDISSWAGGQSDVMIRFRYESPGTGLRYGYWYFNDFSIYSPTSTVEDYNQTVSVSLAAGEMRTVQLPDWAFPPADEYDVTATITIAGDEDTSNDQIIVTGIPIGDVDVAIDSIDAPQWSQIGPADFTPEVTVSQITTWEDLTVPVTYSVYEDPIISPLETKFSEDFEDFLGDVNVVDAQSEIRGIETTILDEREGLQEAYIHWISEPSFGSPGQWTVIDNNWDDITWNPEDTGGNIAMYMGDAGSYPADCDDWFLSPPINVGADCSVYLETYLDTEGYPYDYLIVYFSPDGYSFSGYALNAIGGWYAWDLPVPASSLISADGTVYIAFRYISDSTVQVGEGPYIDNIDIKGSAAIYSETVNVVFDGAETKSVTFPTMSGLEFDKYYVVQASVQHPRDLVPTNDELSMYFDTFVSIYNTRTGKAFGTIQAAIDDVDTLDGDTILVRDGTYTEDIVIWKDITVMGQNPPTSTTILHGTVTITGDGATLQNFKVWPLVTFTDNAAAVMIYASDVTIQDNIICNVNGLVDPGLGAGYFTVKGIHAYGGEQTPIHNIDIYNNIIENIINDNVTAAAPGWNLLKNYVLPGTSPETWYNDVIDLSAYDGETIQLAWQYVSDNEWAAYFDDILVSDGSTFLFEDFDSYPNDYTFDGTSTCGFWDQENYGTACGSTYHYIMVEDYKSHSSPYSAELYYNCPNDDWLVSPQIDCSAASGLFVDFWYLWDDSWDIEFNVYVQVIGGGGGGGAPYGGADGIMIQGFVDDVFIDGNVIQNVHSKGWCYGVEITPTVTTTLGAYPDVLLTEGFEGTGLPTGWLNVDNDGDGWLWDCDKLEPDFPAHSGTQSAGSYSWDYTTYLPLNPDNYLITPQIDLTGYTAADLTFWVAAQDVDYPADEIEVWVSTGGNGVGDFTDLIYEYVETDDVWKEHILDLTSYAGGQIYIAFVHTDCTDWFMIKLDDVEVTAEAGGGPGPSGAAPTDVEITCNEFYTIGDGSFFDDQAYDGICLTIDETVPGADDGDATEVEAHCNFFDLGLYAIINKDTDGVLDATENFYGASNGPSGGAIDPVDMALADGFGAAIVPYGPVHFSPFLGLYAHIASPAADPITVEVGEVVAFDSDGSYALIFDECCDPYVAHMQYEWDFDDGYYSHNPATTHVYDSAGTYYVRLMIDSPGFGWWNNLMYGFDYCTVIVVEPDSPLGANADGGNLGGYEGMKGEPIEFFGTASGGNGRYSYTWDFGDGATAKGSSPTHTYELSGVYDVTLTVTDLIDSSIATDTTTATVLDIEELYVNIKGTFNVMEGQLVQFVGQVAGGKGPYSYDWNFGDGVISTEQSPKHIYENDGTYTLTLTVTDANQDSETTTKTVTVGAPGETEEVEITDVKGGLSLSATINSDKQVDWTIDVQGFVLWGGHADGTAVGTSIVKLPFSIGFGKVDILITAGDLQDTYSATMFGPFLFNVKEA